jgi:hypothetical protein
MRCSSEQHNFSQDQNYTVQNAAMKGGASRDSARRIAYADRAYYCTTLKPWTKYARTQSLFATGNGVGS